MDFIIRKINKDDKNDILSMMEDFYSSDAVFTNGSKEIFETDYLTCINQSPYLEGYIFKNNSKTLGYAMISKSFSTEYAKPCIWLEDLYLKPDARGLGIIPSFFKYIKQEYPDCIYKLEVEKENTHAIHVYKKAGFFELPYIVMKTQV